MCQGRATGRPTFARSRVAKLTALKRDLTDHLDYCNWDRGHTGRTATDARPA